VTAAGTAPPPPRRAGAAPAAASLSVVVVIARYPPHHRGGYELRCRDVCRELVRRGHRVTVLTSRVGGRGTTVDDGVRVVRELHLWEMGVPNGAGSVLSFVRASGADSRRLRRTLRRARADAVAYWHQQGLTSALLAVRPPRGCGILCDVSSDWPVDAATGGNWFRIWEKPSRTWLRRTAKGALRLATSLLLRAPTTRPKFPPGRAYYTSLDRKHRHLEQGVAAADAALVRSGIHLELFPFRAERPSGGPRQTLFLGRVKRRKGLHTAVLAMSYLPEDVHLQVVGDVEDPEYLAEVAELVRATKVSHRVRIRDKVPHEDVPAMLRDVHALLFASEEPEAFSRLVLESFACGTPVVGTTLGGTGEVLLEGETGLTFQPGNARQLADQLRRVLTDAELRARLVANARSLVETKYALGYTVGQIEALLREAHAAASPAPAPAARAGA
jgi:glycogen synthase